MNKASLNTTIRLITLAALLGGLLSFHSPASIQAQGSSEIPVVITFDSGVLPAVVDGVLLSVDGVLGGQIDPTTGKTAPPSLITTQRLPALSQLVVTGASATQDPETGRITLSDFVPTTNGAYSWNIRLAEKGSRAISYTQPEAAYAYTWPMLWHSDWGTDPVNCVGNNHRQNNTWEASFGGYNPPFPRYGDCHGGSTGDNAAPPPALSMVPRWNSPPQGITLTMEFSSAVTITQPVSFGALSNTTVYYLDLYNGDTLLETLTVQKTNSSDWHQLTFPAVEHVITRMVFRVSDVTAHVDDIAFAYEIPPEPNVCADRRFEFENPGHFEGWSPPDESLTYNLGGQPEGFVWTDMLETGSLYAPGYHSGATEYLNAWYSYESGCLIESIAVRWRTTASPGASNALGTSAPPPFNITLYQENGAPEPADWAVTAEYQGRLDTGQYDRWIETTWYPVAPQSAGTTADHINLYFGYKDNWNLDGSEPLAGQVWVDWIEVQASAPQSWNLTHALAAADRLAVGEYGSPFQADYALPVTMFSRQWGDPVHAIAGGTVESVLPTAFNTPSLCFTEYFGYSRGRWGTGLLDLISDIAVGLVSLGVDLNAPEGSCLLSHPDLPFGGIYWTTERINRMLNGQPYNAHDIYISFQGTATVVVDSPGLGKLRYLVREPTVQAGDAVQAGCRLGQTTGFYPERDSLLTSGWTTLELANEGVTLIALYDETAGLHRRLMAPYFQQEPTGEACVEGAVESQCLNHNPQFQGLSGWAATNPTTTTLTEGGLKLTGITYHEHIIALDPDSEYSIVVEARLENPAPDGQPSVLQIGLGDTRPPNAPLEISIPADGSTVRATVPPSIWPANYAPDQYELYLNPKLFNSGTIVVDFLCISDNEGAPVHLPTSCYFADPNFDTGGGWIPSSGNVNGDPVFGHGAVAIPHGGYVGQTVTLSPGDYTIEYTGRRHPTLFTGEPYIEVTWDFGVHSGGRSLAYTTWEQGADNFTVTETTTAQFTFTATNGVNADETAIQLDRVCIVPSTGPPPTGGTIGGGDTGTGCRTCNYTPSSDVAHNIVEMTSWLGCKVDAIWYCEAEPIAKSTEEGIHEIVRGVGMLGRFLSYSFTVGLKQAESGAYYLAGHIHNAALRIADGRVIMIEDQSIGFWDVLNSLITGLRDVLVTALDNIVQVLEMLLDFLAPAVSTLANLIVGVANILITVFNLLLAQVMLIPALAATVVNSFVQASAMPIPGAPNCAVLNSNPLCMGIYVIDNTIFSGPAGLLIPILLASATLWLAIWTIDRFAGAFR